MRFLPRLTLAPSRGMPMRRAPLALGIACVLLAGVLLGARTTRAHRPPAGTRVSLAEHTSSGHTAAALPASLQRLASRVIGASEHSLWVSHHGDFLSASDGGVASTFSRSGISVRAGSGFLALKLLGIGHGEIGRAHV